MTTKPGSTAGAVATGTALDGGACCESVDNFTAFVGTLKDGYVTHTAPTKAASIAGVTMTSYSCPALMTASNTYAAKTGSTNNN